MKDFQFTSTTKPKINKKKLYKRWDKFFDIAAKICAAHICKDCPFSYIHKKKQLCLFALLDNVIEDINNKEQK